MLPSLLLGGVLNGEVLSPRPSKVGSGANVDLAVGSAECDLLGILGLPARLMGGGTEGVEAAGLVRSKDPLLRGSTEETATEFDGRNGFPSKAGVDVRLGILKNLPPLECGEPRAADSNDARGSGSGREGRGACIGLSGLFAGDLGECTSTLGGDLVADRGGENAIIEDGRALGVLHGARRDLPRGVVAETGPL